MPHFLVEYSRHSCILVDVELGLCLAACHGILNLRLSSESSFGVLHLTLYSCSLLQGRVGLPLY